MQSLSQLVSQKFVGITKLKMCSIELTDPAYCSDIHVLHAEMLLLLYISLIVGYNILLL
jgi:hypothetical protein